MINRKQLIKKYIDFFKSKKHKEVPNSSLIPENDPTVLFTTAGMHPLVPYLLGQPHPSGKRLVNVQRCIRTGDIDEVGDEVHHTFFEMLGNWSLGDYFKKEAIEFSFEFLTKVLKIPTEKLAISVFGGNDRAKKDEEAAEIWEKLGIPKKRIVYLDYNWWETAGAGPCGTDTEMFYWKPKDLPAPEKFDPKDENWVEIWNDVLMGFKKDAQSKYTKSDRKNIDTGMGVERTVTILNGLEDNYLSEMWLPIIKQIEKISKKPYQGNERPMRIIADHLKAAVFVVADGVVPSNTEQGYVLRRLVRRATMYGKELGMKKFAAKVAEPIFKVYEDYPELKNKKKILNELEKEEEKFEFTLEKGLTKFKKMSLDKVISGKEAFLLYQSYGFPKEMIAEECEKIKVKFDEKEFNKELQKHQELSQTASAGKFKSGLADNSEATTKLHTATHLLLQALKIILKDDAIIQRGSNITPERLRFDFSFDRKLTEKEVKEIEDLVNSQIQNSCEVIREEMSPQEAKENGACGIFDKKYGDRVSVYTIGDFSKEICSGPHVKNLCELGRFKIKKQESSSAGVRRIKAILE